MKRTLCLTFGIFLTFLHTASSFAEDPVMAGPHQRSAIAVYSDGISVVREQRSVDLPGGPVRVNLPDLPEALDISTLSIRINNQPVESILLRKDRLSPQSLLMRSLGREVTWLVPEGETGTEREITGVLVNIEGGIVLKVGDRYEAMPAGRLALNRLPSGMSSGGLEVVAAIESKPGPSMIALRYSTPSLSWSGDYEATLLSDNSRIRLGGHYQISNQTGTDFRQAALRLVAGETRRIQPAGPEMKMMRAESEAVMSMDLETRSAPPRTAGLGDVHIYDLQERVNLPAYQTLRRVLLEPVILPVQKTYRLNGSGLVPHNRISESVEGLRPSVTLSFDNMAGGSLSRALPAGPVRVYGSLGDDPEDAPEILLGEDHLPHLPVGGTAKLSLGRAFDVTARRSVTDYKASGSADKPWQEPYQATHEITLKNGRPEAVTVTVVEAFQARRWEIRDASQEPEQQDASHMTWDIPIPAQGQTVLTYTVRVTP